MRHFGSVSRACPGIVMLQTYIYKMSHCIQSHNNRKQVLFVCKYVYTVRCGKRDYSCFLSIFLLLHFIQKYIMFMREIAMSDLWTNNSFRFDIFWMIHSQIGYCYFCYELQQVKVYDLINNDLIFGHLLNQILISFQAWEFTAWISICHTNLWKLYDTLLKPLLILYSRIFMKIQIAFHSAQLHGSLYTIILLFFIMPSFF